MRSALAVDSPKSIITGISVLLSNTGCVKWSFLKEGKRQVISIRKSAAQAMAQLARDIRSASKKSAGPSIPTADEVKQIPIIPKKRSIIIA